MKIIATRELLFSHAGETKRQPLVLKILAPEPIKEHQVNFKFDDGAAVCSVEFDGLPEPNIEMHGVDTLHALKQAVDVDPILKSMCGRYDFFWHTGEPYFD